MARNRHHIWWPKKQYAGSTDKRFRNLPCNVVWIDEMAHRLLHAYSLPPNKPSHSYMSQAINNHDKGFCSCGT